MYRNVLLGIVFASLATGCASTRQVGVAESGRVSALEDAWRGSTDRIEEVERREEELAERYLSLRTRLEGLIESHRELRGELSLVRQSLEARPAAVTIRTGPDLEAKLVDIEHRLEGLTAERKALIEVLERVTGSSGAVPTVADRNP